MSPKSVAAAVNTNSGLWRRRTYSFAALERPQIATHHSAPMARWPMPGRYGFDVLFV
jgi:hypothetical protein